MRAFSHRPRRLTSRRALKRQRPKRSAKTSKRAQSPPLMLSKKPRRVRKGRTRSNFQECPVACAMGAGRLFAAKNLIFQSKTGETACGELARPSACQDLFDKPRATALSSAQSSPAVVGARGFCVPNSKKSSANRRGRRLLARPSACQSPFYRLTPNSRQCTDVSHCLPAAL